MYFSEIIYKIDNTPIGLLAGQCVLQASILGIM